MTCDWDTDAEWDWRPLTWEEREDICARGKHLDDYEPNLEQGSDGVHRLEPPGLASLYFVDSSVGKIKIGQSSNVLSRVANMQTGCPVRLWLLVEVPCAGDLEPVAHEVFSDERDRGEWFDGSPRLRRFVDRLRAAGKCGKLDQKVVARELLAASKGGP